MAHALEHHNYFSAAFTPIKSGLMEAIGVNDAGHDIISKTPNKALDALMRVEIPTFEGSKAFAKKYEECHKELKELNDKNDSSILMWSYMINNLYNKTLNDIAQFSNTQMEDLNRVFNSWKQKMDTLLNEIKKEKGKLGLA